MKSLTIGEVARHVGVSVETVRFYEREGLLKEPVRRVSGYRQYQDDAIDRLQFIKRVKGLGFSLKEIKELLALSIAPDTTCGQVKQRAKAKIEDIEGKIKALQ